MTAVQPEQNLYTTVVGELLPLASDGDIALVSGLVVRRSLHNLNSGFNATLQPLDKAFTQPHATAVEIGSAVVRELDPTTASPLAIAQQLHLRRAPFRSSFHPSTVTMSPHQPADPTVVKETTDFGLLREAKICLQPQCWESLATRRHDYNLAPNDRTAFHKVQAALFATVVEIAHWRIQNTDRRQPRVA